MTLFSINLLHVLNDGFRAGLLLLLPFIAKEFRIDLTSVGFLGSVLNIFEAILAIPAGMLAIKFGGYRLLIAALLIYSLGFFLSSISMSFNFIIIAFLIAGVGFAVFHPVALSIVAKISHKLERGKKLGDFTAIADLGRIGISSLITFVIVYIGWRKTSLISFLILFSLFIFYLKFFLKKENKSITTHHEKDTVRYKEILKNKRFIFVSLSFMFDCFASYSLFIFIPFLLLKRGVRPEFLGIITATFFVGNFFGKTLLGRFADKYGNTNIFIISEIFMAIFILILSNSTLLPLIIMASVMLGAFTKGTTPVLMSMVSDSVEHHGRYEKAFGLNAFNVAIAGTAAPLVLGFVADKYGIVNSFNFAAFMAIIAIIPAFVLKRISKV